MVKPGLHSAPVGHGISQPRDDFSKGQEWRALCQDNQRKAGDLGYGRKMNFSFQFSDLLKGLTEKLFVLSRR